MEQQQQQQKYKHSSVQLFSSKNTQQKKEEDKRKKLSCGTVPFNRIDRRYHLKRGRERQKETAYYGRK